MIGRTANKVQRMGHLRHYCELVLFHNGVYYRGDALEVVLRDCLVGALERRDEVDERIWGASSDVDSWRTGVVLASHVCRADGGCTFDSERHW